MLATWEGGKELSHCSCSPLETPAQGQPSGSPAPAPRDGSPWPSPTLS